MGDVKLCQKCGTEKRSCHGRRDGKPRIQWYCPSCQRTRTKKYTSLKKREWDRRNKLKRLAHKQVELAILRGELTKMNCSVCGASKAHAHHEDYDKPLDIVWLCPVHHGERHRQIRQEKRRHPARGDGQLGGWETGPSQGRASP